VVAVTATASAAGYALDTAVGADDTAPPPLGPGLVTVEVDMSYSTFSLDDLHVYEGTLVRFVVQNSDPINHELVIGNDEVHARHATGTEAFHPPVPGELSLGPDEKGLTTYLFDEPGPVTYACHLAGHVQYGMVGEITVVPLPDGDEARAQGGGTSGHH
jgi:uncharacterized cupredoxin-like copper-binding protein